MRNGTHRLVAASLVASIAAACWIVAPDRARATPEGKLSVVVTVQDLASIAREVGGDQVEVTHLVRGTMDPHFVAPTPSVREFEQPCGYLSHARLQVAASPASLR